MTPDYDADTFGMWRQKAEDVTPQEAAAAMTAASRLRLFVLARLP